MLRRVLRELMHILTTGAVIDFLDDVEELVAWVATGEGEKVFLADHAGDGFVAAGGNCFYYAHIPRKGCNRELNYC